MKTKIQRLSICECGFSLFNESINIGTEYDLAPLQVEVEFQCGGCGRKFETQAVFASREGTAPGWIPLGAFQPNN